MKIANCKMQNEGCREDDDGDCGGCWAAILMVLVAVMIVSLVVMWGRIWTVDQRLERIEQKLKIPAEQPPQADGDLGCAAF